MRSEIGGHLRRARTSVGQGNRQGLEEIKEEEKFTSLTYTEFLRLGEEATQTPEPKVRVRAAEQKGSARSQPPA